MTSAGLIALAILLCTGHPARAQYRVFWGDVHGHTGLSDGKGTPADYFRHARDSAKLDFAIVSDHDFGHAPPWRMPTNDWRLTQTTADEFTDSGRFVAIAGYEWTSQTKYWTGAGAGSERLFPGAPRHFNHKNVYSPARVDYLFSAKDRAFFTPDLLADAVRTCGGLIHNNHPDAGPDSTEQFAYAPTNTDVIANTEMLPDIIRYRGSNHVVNAEQMVRAFLARGGRTGFINGSDTHEGKPAARTAILARELTRAAVFDALRHRRNYAITNARILLDFQVNGHVMGEEFEIAGAPQLVVDVQGTSPIKEVTVIRDGHELHTARPGTPNFHWEHADRSCPSASYYYVRVVQADVDKHGNPSHAWSSPIWVKRKPSAGD